VVVTLPGRVGTAATITPSGPGVTGGGTLAANAGGTTVTTAVIVPGVRTSEITVTLTLTGDAACTTNSEWNTVTITVPANHISVTGITGLPTTGTVGIPLTLSGTVVPSNAANQTIQWSLGGGSTAPGASVTGGVVNATGEGTVNVIASITSGITIGTPFVLPFTINFSAPPTAPQNFTATAGDTQVTLAWTAPLNDGGSAITGFEVSSDNGTTWVAASSNTGHTFTSLTNGTAYIFRVRAINIAGVGAEASETATPVAVIDIFVKEGVTPPALGAAPVTAITPTAQFTGAVTWEHSGGTAGAVFGAERVYTATITLTPETGFTLTGVAADSFTVAGATTVTNAADSGIITAVFSATAALPPTIPGRSPDRGTPYRPPVSTPVTHVTHEPAVPPEVLPYAPTEDASQFPFIDVSMTDWFYQFVRTVWENQLFHGTSHDTFTPQGSMTRAMFIQVLANIEGIITGTNAQTVIAGSDPQSPHFVDISPTAWYFPVMEWAASEGLLSGVGNGNFTPSEPITREEMAVLLNNFIVSRDITLPQGATSLFTDHNSISDWALADVLAIQAAGIITGYPDGTFAPSNTATRAEVAAIFARFLDAADIPRREQLLEGSEEE